MNVSAHFSNPVISTGRQGAVAVALSLAMLTGCGDDREDRTPVPQDAQTGPAVSEPYREEIREPQGDVSITEDSSGAAEMAQLAMVDLAAAEIKPTDGNEIFGTVYFRPSDDQRTMRVSVDISGLQAGKHGFHIHENGDCSAPDASSAGGHLNPYSAVHGAPNHTEHHVGDMGNVDANAEGRVEVELEIDDLAFSGPASILQKAVVIHAGADDLNTDPSGASGDRLGCGVIRPIPEVLPESAQPGHSG